MHLKYICIILNCFLILRSCERKDLSNDQKENSNQHLPDFVEEQNPIESTFFSTVFIEPNSSYNPLSDGDLWPSAWSDDNILYSANGDGKGFNINSSWSDIVLNKIEGNPDNRSISGSRIFSGNFLSQVWGNNQIFNRKPTGLISDHGILYMAVQDLVKEGPNIFNEAPTATIIRSEDKGETWNWNKNNPMFDNHIFTTIFFLDYGKDSRNNNFDSYSYAYGIDNNWRDSFSDVVEDPRSLYLARIPEGAIQDKSQWQFYTGDTNGNASWSDPGNINSKKSVLKDDRRVYEDEENLSVISQGSVVYNKPLDRYIYTSWTEFTFEFYESPKPWGPWKLFFSKDFGRYPWADEYFGGYATTIPSKFINENGEKMWVVSSTFTGGVKYYNFSMRQLWVSAAKNNSAANEAENVNLAQKENLTIVAPIWSGKIRGGDIRVINDGKLSQNLDSFGEDDSVNDYWGYTFKNNLNLNQLIYTTGEIKKDYGGWFENIKIQVRKNFVWTDVENLEIDPSYTFNRNIESNTSYSFTFDQIQGNGIRIIGLPGGAANYTSISELEVYFKQS